MAAERRRGRAKDFLLGGLVGASAVVATARRRTLRGARGEAPERPAGLAAFEGAPCFEEMLEQREVDADS